jgi:hypothetical protein
MLIDLFRVKLKRSWVGVWTFQTMVTNKITISTSITTNSQNNKHCGNFKSDLEYKVVSAFEINHRF